MTGPGPGHGALSAGELARLRGIGREQVSAWDQGLRAAGVPLSRALLCGSAQTGLLETAKPARYRGSPPGVLPAQLRPGAGDQRLADRPVPRGPAPGAPGPRLVAGLAAGPLDGQCPDPAR